MLLIAKYDKDIDSVDNLAKMAQFTKRTTCKIHYNPLITKFFLSIQNAKIKWEG